MPATLLKPFALGFGLWMLGARFYQVHLGQMDFGNAESGTRVLPFATFCRELHLP
jgi:hypothetical protein